MTIPAPANPCPCSPMVSRMSALVYYLKEDDIKNSDTGEAALLEQDREEEEHVKLLQVKLSYRYHCIMTC